MPIVPTSSLELETQRRITVAFIAFDSVYVSLIPRTRTPTGTGGWVWTQQIPRPIQAVLLLPLSDGVGATPTLDGVDRQTDYLLLGEWNALISVGDVFAWDNDDWEVKELYDFNGYEQRARVTRRNQGAAT